MATVIEVRGLSKKYMLRHQGTGYLTLRDSLTEGARSLVAGLAGKKRANAARETFWALYDVSFDVQQGDRVGVAGRNGAGKSTLLKILSRITEPTIGKITLHGRVASLLEVGTGFHPELTGRENIFLNGAVLGMRKSEIRSKFDEIVAFAEVERFLDTPVKRYSSGMYVRLAFAVAAHLEPEILILDEVLAVGDAAFQRKCLGRMEDVSREGRTVIFVSHNMGAVRQLCNKGIYLDSGHATCFDNVEGLIAAYQSATIPLANGRKNTVVLEKHGLTLDNFVLDGRPLETQPEVFCGEPLTIDLDYRSDKNQDLCLSVGLRSKSTGNIVIYTHNHLEAVRHVAGRTGHVQASLKVPRLAPGRYALEMQCWLDSHLAMDTQEVGEFAVLPVPAFATQQTLAGFPATVLIDSIWKFTDR